MLNFIYFSFVENVCISVNGEEGLRLVEVPFSFFQIVFLLTYLFYCCLEKSEFSSKRPFGTGNIHEMVKE